MQTNLVKRGNRPQASHAHLGPEEQFVVLDVRSPLLFAQGHVPRSHNIPAASLQSCLAEIGAERTAVIVCETEEQYATACRDLVQEHPKVIGLIGGTIAWGAAGLGPEPVLRPSRRIDRQTHLVAGLMLASAFVLARVVSPDWIYLALLPTFGLLLDAISGICPMTMILRRMPWNSHGHNSGCSSSHN